jgi:putative ABC transport system permease protein
MAPKIAYKNLFHDTTSLLVTLIGIVFSVVLVAVQCGLYLGSEETIASMQDHTKADLWITPMETKSFDDASFLPGRERFAALSTPGVSSAEDLVVGFGLWRKPAGGMTSVLIIGSNHTSEGLMPWDVVDGTVRMVAAPGGVAVDQTYFKDLGIKALGDTAEINGTKVTVHAVTKGIRSFTTMPFIFTSLPRARALLNANVDQSSYTLLRLAPGANVADVRKSLGTRLNQVEILSHDEFRQRSLDYWLFETGAGAALIAGAVLGLIVGIVIVTQTLYASTKDHLNEFATLRALGASSSYIVKVILYQALLSAFLGYAAGIALSMLVVWASKQSTLLIVMTPKLALGLFCVTVGMCVLAAISAIFKVTRIDPAGVFSR